MEFYKKILMEAAGVPMAIIPALNELMDPFEKLGENILHKEFEKTIKITPTENFPLESVDFTYYIKPENTSKIFFNGGTNLFGLKKNNNNNYSVEIYVSAMVPFFNFEETPNNKEMLVLIKSVLLHELTHVYEDIRRKVNNNIGLGGAKHNISSLAASNLLSSSSMPKEIYQFVFNMYSAASFEVSARIAQVYPALKGISDVDERIDIVKKSVSWDIANDLENSDYNKFMINLKSDLIRGGVKNTDKKINELIAQLIDILKNYNNNFEDGPFQNLKLNSSPELMSKTEKIIHSVISKNTEISKNTNSFLRYWFRAFKYAGEKSKRKLLRLANRTDLN